MSLVNTLKQLKTNIFGGPGNTGFEKPPAYKTRINLDTPAGILDHDPFQFGTYQYPLDMIEGGQLGHYMVFYVNVVDSTKFKYENQNQAEYDYAKSNSTILQYLTDVDEQHIQILHGVVE